MNGIFHFLVLFLTPFLLCSVSSLHKVEGLCLEKIGNEAYLNMVPHPDGSKIASLSNQQCKIWLVGIPDEGCGGVLDITKSEPFFDISD